MRWYVPKLCFFQGFWGTEQGFSTQQTTQPLLTEK